MAGAPSAEPEGVADAAAAEETAPVCHRGTTMQLHVVRGSYRTPGGSPFMDPKIWGRMPDDILLRVVPLLPAHKHFELQAVSRKWRQVLTSANFRARAAAAAAARAREQQGEQEPQQPGLVACVARRLVEPRANCKVAELDLASFVPSWFWKPRRGAGSFFVVAAGDGLVYISNDQSEPDRYCALNPATRTCRVLPELPFQPDQWLLPSPTTVAAVRFELDRLAHGYGMHVQVATHDLAMADAAGGGGGGWDVAECMYQGMGCWVTPVLALCAGEAYLYNNTRPAACLYVLAPAGGGGGGGGGRLEWAGYLDEPSVTTLGMDTSSYPAADQADYAGYNYVLAHRGAVYFTKHLRTYSGVDLVLGVWRLARARLQWEPVARLDVADLLRLDIPGFRLRTWRTGGQHGCYVWGACGVQELLWFHVEEGVDMEAQRRAVLGLDLETGEWRVVHCEQDLLHGLVQTAECVMDSGNVSRPLELRPDLFL